MVANRLAWACACAQALCLGTGVAGELIDFGRVPREIAKTPAFVASEPLYGLFLFGKDGERRVWAILDKSAKGARAYDVLYLDLNANGDLAEPGERFVGKAAPGTDASGSSCRFEIGRFREPGTQRFHTEFALTWRPGRVSYEMKWLGDKPTMGGYGPDPQTYGTFAATPRHAPILVPGHDLPFQFQHWMSGTLRRDQETDFKLFVGNLGNGPGTFSCVDDKFLPADRAHYVVATLRYKDRAGQSREARYELKHRC